MEILIWIAIGIMGGLLAALWILLRAGALADEMQRSDPATDFDLAIRRAKVRDRG